MSARRDATAGESVVAWLSRAWTHCRAAMTAAWRRRVGPVRPAPRAALARRAFTELPTGHLDDWNAAHTAACRQREHLHRQAERAWWSRRA